MDFYIIAIYILTFLMLRAFVYPKWNAQMFSIVIITSGSVYISAAIALLILLYELFIKRQIALWSIVTFTFITIPILIFQFLQEEVSVNYSELLQLFLFILLSIQMLSMRKRIDDEFRESIARGFLVGSILLAGGLAIRSGFSTEYNQSEFNYLSISGTFNYTAYYLFFGLIIAPYYFKLSFYRSLLLFVVYIYAIIIFEARAAFALGTLAFIYVFLPKSRLKRYFLAVPVVLSLVYFFISSGYFDVRNQNDMIYSITNFNNNRSNIQRLDMINKSITSLNEFPFGWGVGHSKEALNYFGFDHPHAHNFIANWFYEMGLFGIVLSALFVILLIRMSLVKKTKLSYSIVVFILMYSLTESVQYNILMSFITLVSLFLLSNKNTLIE